MQRRWRDRLATSSGSRTSTATTGARRSSTRSCTRSWSRRSTRRSTIARARGRAHAPGGVPAGRPARRRRDLAARPLPVDRPRYLVTAQSAPRPQGAGALLYLRRRATLEPMTAVRYGAQSMTAPLREVVLALAWRGIRAGVRGSRRTASCTRSISSSRAGSTRAVRAAGQARGACPRPGRGRPWPGLRLRLRPAADHGSRRRSVALRQANAPRRGGGARSLDGCSRPSRRLGRIAAPATVDGGDTFWLRPDLLCHRPLAAHQPRRRRSARGHRRRPGRDLRRAVLARSGRGPPPAERHLADRRRPRGRLPASCCPPACTSCSPISACARSRSKRLSSRPWAATFSLSGRAS